MVSMTNVWDRAIAAVLAAPERDMLSIRNNDMVDWYLERYSLTPGEKATFIRYLRGLRNKAS